MINMISNEFVAIWQTKAWFLHSNYYLRVSFLLCCFFVSIVDIEFLKNSEVQIIEQVASKDERWIIGMNLYIRIIVL